MKGVSYPLPSDLSDVELEDILFPGRNKEKVASSIDFEKAHKEMSKSGVTLSLLCNEYCVQCSTAGKLPLGYSQYCRLYRQYTQINGISSMADGNYNDDLAASNICVN